MKRFLFIAILAASLSACASTQPANDAGAGGAKSSAQDESSKGRKHWGGDVPGSRYPRRDS